MASFGLSTAADFLEKLREERRDFVLSKCLDPRHAVNAVMTAYHLCERVFPEMQGRSEFAWEGYKQFRASLGQPIEDAGRITNGTKHFQSKPIKTGKHKGTFQRGVFQGNVFDVSYLWLERDGKEQRAEDFIDELVKFWDRFFRDHGLQQYADAVGRSGKRRCRCGEEFVDCDIRGEHVTGCLGCNFWEPLSRPSMRLSTEDLTALRLQRGWKER